MSVKIKLLLMLVIFSLVVLISCSSNQDQSVVGGVEVQDGVEDNLSGEPELESEETSEFLCTPQWKCISSRFRAYQGEDCNFTNKRGCSLGCEEGLCIDGSDCEFKVKCKDKVTKAIQTIDCNWKNQEICKAGCSDGKCNPEPEVIETIDEETGEVLEIIKPEVFRLNFAEGVTVNLNNNDYVIQAYNIESGRVKLKVNGVSSDWIYEGGNATVAEGNVFIVVKEILFQAYPGGTKEVGFTINWLE